MNNLHYIPVVLAALAVLALGWWNPVQIQSKVGGVSNGCPDYKWLSLAALVVGLLGCYLCCGKGALLKGML